MSIDVMTRPPRTMMEAFRSLPEGTLVQLIENNIVMSPAPKFQHQEMVMKIISRLQPFIEKNQLGQLVVAPVDVYLGNENAFQPDILFIRNERKSLIEEDGLHGAPDLVIEILSPSTARYDLEEKKDVYERFGVKEYWIVEPESQSVNGYALVHDSFEEIPANKGEINSRLLEKRFIFQER